MKNIVIGLFTIAVILVAGWYFLSPLVIDNNVSEALPVQSESSEIGELDAAAFQDADSFHKTSGQAKIVQSENTKYLRFENFEATNGPDLKVYLAKDLAAGNFISLGDLKGNIGDQNYELPADFNAQEYPYVLIWCEQFSVLFSSAQLS